MNKAGQIEGEFINSGFDIIKSSRYYDYNHCMR